MKQHYNVTAVSLAETRDDSYSGQKTLLDMNKVKHYKEESTCQ